MTKPDCSSDEDLIVVDPLSRPIVGEDLYQTRLELGASVRDMQWLLAMVATRWAADAGSARPVGKLTTALIVRWMQSNPDLVPIHDTISPVEFFEVSEVYLAVGDVNLSEEQFCMALGRSATALSRWRVTGDEPTAEVSNLVFYLIRELEALSGLGWKVLSDTAYNLRTKERVSGDDEPGIELLNGDDLHSVVAVFVEFWRKWLATAGKEVVLRESYQRK